MEGAFKWKRFTEETLSELTYTAKNLKQEEVYEFRVAAENKAGVGPFSDNSMAVKAKEPIGKSFVIILMQMKAKEPIGK